MRSLVLCVLVISLGAGGPARADSSTTTRHLLAGVQAFQNGAYEEALVELRVVARAADAPADLAFYLGPTLYKLGRYREALAVFLGSSAAPDELTTLYVGETYYQLGLYRKARVVFAGLHARGLGPVIDEAAVRYVAAIDLAYREPPTAQAIDAYIAQARDAARDLAVSAEILEEARAVEALATARHRHDEIAIALATTWNAIGRAKDTIGMLGAKAALPVEGTWQLARAYRATGDDAHARPLLQKLVTGGGERARDAAALLAPPSP